MSDNSDVAKKIKDIAEISGESLSDKDISRIKNISTLLNLSNNDPFLSVLVVLDHYFRLNRNISNEIDCKLCEEKSNRLKRNLFQIIISSFIVLCITYVSYLYGVDRGIETRNLKIEIEKIQIEDKKKFINSKVFNDIYYLYKEGELEDIIYCRKKGWEIVNGMCVPYTFKQNGIDTYSMWIVPKSK